MRDIPACARLNRRQLLRAGAALGLLGTAPALAQQRAPREVVIDEANIQPRPIAVPPFVSPDPKLGADIGQVVAADLESSGLFKLLAPAGYPERFANVNQTPRTRDWASSGAEALVVGQATPIGDGRVQVEYRLWDTVLSKNVDGKRLAHQNWRRLSHIVADQIYEKLTLEKGYFDSQIVFIDESGPKDRRAAWRWARAGRACGSPPVRSTAGSAPGAAAPSSRMSAPCGSLSTGSVVIHRQ